MEEKMITIPVEEYKKFMEVSVRINILAEYIKKSRYNTDWDMCVQLLGDFVKEKED